MNEILKCIDCSSDNLCYLYGSYVCLGCGLLKTDTIPEVSNETSEIYNSTYLQKGSNTKVVKDNKYIKADIYKLHVQITYSSAERSYSKICDIIDQLELAGTIKNKTKEIWKNIPKVYKGYFRKGMLACCIYYSCINNNYPIDSEEVCKLLLIETKYFNSANKEFILIFSEKYKDLITKTLTINDYLNRYCYKLDLSKEKQFNLLKDCIIFLNKKELPETSPKLITSSIIYIVCQNNKYPIDKNSISKILPMSSKVINDLN